ncbi:hypothetical protein OG500_19270 [Kitasatospora sp. NBC_01250]|uniref:hypothetical protein n=1 Tax=Kitasatospora sp. NBC_01250 TaxID=2903571 RepID=UPI002E3403DD|nr:hypothetical protein [Kitasatospora sp. NBC_01250]
MILGIEGVSCVGKTTLAISLTAHLHRPVVVPCYFHASPDPTLLPAPEPFTAEHQLANIAQFLDIEKLRFDRMRQALAEGRDVILDRTVDTLLAHAHAVGRINGFDCDGQARNAVANRVVAVPELTILLTTAPDVLTRRARLRKGMPTIFYDRHFAEHFNAYFDSPTAPAVATIDTTTGSPDELTVRALEQISLHLDSNSAQHSSKEAR